MAILTDLPLKHSAKVIFSKTFKTEYLRNVLMYSFFICYYYNK